ncbi:MAG: ABC transporter ATP-binding protein [Acidobacteriota bacterium]
MAPVIQLQDLVVHLGSAPILKGLSCELAGPTIGLLGPNGAGKSTLIRSLLGFHDAAGGTARVLGLDPQGEARDIRSQVGYMPEHDSFISGQTAIRFVRYMAELHGLPTPEAMERAHEALFWVGLGEARYREVDGFSTGMKQRVKLAQAIVHSPSLVILDEPTNGLDPPGRARMLELVKELAATDGLTLLVSSHVMGDIETCADEVLILKEGRVARVHQLRAEREGDHRFLEIELVGDEAPFLHALNDLGLAHSRGTRQRLRVATQRDFPVAKIFQAALDAGVTVRSLVQREDTLREVFLDAMEVDVSANGGAA